MFGGACTLVYKWGAERRMVYKPSGDNDARSNDNDALTDTCANERLSVASQKRKEIHTAT